MSLNPIKILLIEDNPGDADLIIETLSDVESEQTYDVTHVDRLNDGFDKLWHETFDLVFLDISLPDSNGIDSVATISKELPGLPVLVLTGLDDEKDGRKSDAVRSAGLSGKGTI